MKTTPYEGVIENAYGKKLPDLKLADGSNVKVKLINYSFTVEEFEGAAEVRSANEWPKDSDIVDYVNNRRKANARQKQMQVELDALGIVKPDLKNDPDLRLRKMYEIFVSNGSTHDEARAEAASALKMEWSD